MAWVHLVGNGIPLPAVVAATIGDHTRFAAGAFVLLSGAGVRATYGEALACGGETARSAARRLWRRAVLLLMLDRWLAVAMAMLNWQRSVLPGGEDLATPLSAFLVFREPGVTGGLLLLYATLLAAVPVAAALSRRTGGFVLVVSSGVLYAVANLAGGALHWPPWTFPVAFWQLFFVLGWVALPAVHWLRDRNTLWVLGWAIFAVVAYLLGLWLRYGGPWPEGRPLVPLAWDFTKVPLRPAELLRYLLAMQVVFALSASMVRLSARLDAAAFRVRCLGRHSLVVYVAHLFIEVPLVELAGSVPPSPFIGSAILVVDALALLLVAASADWLRRLRPSDFWFLPAWVAGLPRGGLVGTASVLASVMALWGVQVALRPSWSAPPAVLTDAVTSEGAEVASDATLEEVLLEIDDEQQAPSSASGDPDYTG